MLGFFVMIFRYQWDLSSIFESLSINYGEVMRMDTDIKSMQPILENIEKLTCLRENVVAYRKWNIIEIKDLIFHHDSKLEREQIFNKINFKIKRGKKIALFGSNGSGKSTLMNLLSGLYIPSHVELKIYDFSFLFTGTASINYSLDSPETRDI
jgi:ATP-binding cassette subfamily B protein